MQYIISEEEFEVYKRCKKVVEMDHTHFMSEECGNKMDGTYTMERLKWALGMRDTFPQSWEFKKSK